MFKTLVMSFAVIALAVGCVKDPEKEAQKMTEDVEAGDNYYKAGIKEYWIATSTQMAVTSETQNVTSESVTGLVNQYEKSRGILLRSKAHYERALKRISENKDTVKVSGQDGIHRNIRQINELLSEIDSRVKTLEVLRVELEKDPSKGKATRPAKDSARSA